MNTGLSSVLGFSGTGAYAWDEGTAALVETGWLLTHCPLAVGSQSSPSLQLPQGPVGTSMTDSVSALTSEECMWETDFALSGKTCES